MSHHDHLTPPTVSKTPSMISSPDDEMTVNDPTHQGPFDKLGPAKKAILLAVFAMATAIDVLNISALLILTPDIAADLGLNAGNVTWVSVQYIWRLISQDCFKLISSSRLSRIVAYTLTFAGFLLFSGRLADIFPAQLVFLSGFGMLGILLLVSSFMDNKYAFLVLRGLQGLAGSMTLPSA
jgi:MFS family permease